MNAAANDGNTETAGHCQIHCLFQIELACTFFKHYEIFTDFIFTLVMLTANP